MLCVLECTLKSEAALTYVGFGLALFTNKIVGQCFTRSLAIRGLILSVLFCVVLC